MKASQLIKELQELVDEHGDQDVNFDSLLGYNQTVMKVVAYDEYEGQPITTEAVEFFLH